MMKNKIPFIDDFKNSLILQYKKDQLNIVRGINGRWPGYSKFSLTVLNFKGDVIHKYNQVLFFQCNTWHDLIIEKACTKQAFNSLLNQFLNDTKTKEVLEKLSSKQLNAVTDNTVAVNKLQIDLLNIKLEKNKIISNLQSLGVNMDGISSSTFVDTKSLTAYNPSYSSEINQVGSSIGTLAGGITNALYANSDRKAVEKIKLVGSKLKLRFRDLDDEEKSITATIPPEILNSPAVLFLPNNPDLNQYMEEASQSLEKKAATAKANVAEQYTRINNELNEQAAASKSKSQSTNSSVESSAITNGPDGNSPEAVRCGRDAINEAKGPNSYYMKLMKNQGCAKYSYQYKQQCIEITLRKCRQYLSQEEIDSYNRINATLIQQIAQMPDCKNFLQK